MNTNAYISQNTMHDTYDLSIHLTDSHVGISTYPYPKSINVSNTINIAIYNMGMSDLLKLKDEIEKVIEVIKIKEGQK